MEVRHGGLGEGEQGAWAWYELENIPELLQWLGSGSRVEQELAEDLFETFQAHLTALHLQQQASHSSRTVCIAGESIRRIADSSRSLFAIHGIPSR